MDLDDEATRRVNGTDKKKTADEMFEELVYEKYEYLEHTDYFQEKTDKIISFRNNKEIAIFNTYDGFEAITMQELQAINKKCEELGWI